MRADAATQAFTLHLYDTTKSKPQPKRQPVPDGVPGGSSSAQADPAQSTRPLRVGSEYESDDDDDMGMGWGWNGMRRRGIISEDTSMKRIKQVRGVDGRWTVTDCDVDRKGQK